MQETYVRWFALSRPQQAAIRSPGAWLTTVASRMCLDLLGSARARRERYVGQWIPEPLPGLPEVVDGRTGSAPVDPSLLATGERDIDRYRASAGALDGLNVSALACGSTVQRLVSPPKTSTQHPAEASLGPLDEHVGRIGCGFVVLRLRGVMVYLDELAQGLLVGSTHWERAGPQLLLRVRHYLAV